MKNFKDKIVVITGAASGMGKAYAEAFAALGSKVAICDTDFNGLKDVAKSIAGLIGDENVYCEKMDVSNKDQVFKFAENVKKQLGNAHVVINNAGIDSGKTPFYNTDLSVFKKIMDVNFYGVVYGTKAFLPQLIANKEAALVNVSSVFGLIGPPEHAEYAASKFAVRGFTESLMAEFHNSSVSIHSLHPGGINTNIARDADPEEFVAKKLITPPEKIVQYVIKCIRKKRLKIVYGNESLKVWLGANLLPKKWLVKVYWWEARRSKNPDNYKDFNPFI